MKQLLLLSIGLFFLFNSYSQFANVTFGDRSIKNEIIKSNKIVKETIYEYDPSNKNSIKDSNLTATFFYDTLGNAVEERLAKIINYGEVITTYSYLYTNSGKILKQVKYNSYSKMVTIFEYEYDSFGNEITKYDYNKDTTRLTIEQKVYNKQNQIIQLLTKLNNNDPFISRQYSYTQDNELARMDALDSKGKVIYSYIYDYDKSLNKKAIYLENANGKNIEEEYFYNKDHQIVKVNSIFKSDTKEVIENLYNPDKTLFETNIYLNGKRVQMNRHYYFKD